MYLIGNVHRYPLLLRPDISPGSMELEKLLKDAIISFKIKFSHKIPCRYVYKFKLKIPFPSVPYSPEFATKRPEIEFIMLFKSQCFRYQTHIS